MVTHPKKSITTNEKKNIFSLIPIPPFNMNEDRFSKPGSAATFETRGFFCHHLAMDLALWNKIRHSQQDKQNPIGSKAGSF
jgi:hypothetical protein